VTHVVVTGGTGGIGRAAAVALARDGYDVTITARDAGRADDARAAILEASDREVAVVMCDLASLASVRDAADEIATRLPVVDVLLNNAGVAVFGRRRETVDGFERQFGVNHLGHFVLTTRLLDRGRISGRIVNVSSAGYGLAKDGLRWDDLQWEQEYDGWQAYGASKLCNLYFTWSLAPRFPQLTANAVHPGFVDTDLGYRRPEEGGKPRPDVATSTIGTGTTKVDVSTLGTPLTPEDGAHTSVYVCTAPELAGVTGAYFDDHQQRVEVTGIAADRDQAERLWGVSTDLSARVLSS
jgi:NAD(P)-dependent dehydrogenase (short-subunit alcohol dehydrogenase family)